MRPQLNEPIFPENSNRRYSCAEELTTNAKERVRQFGVLLRLRLFWHLSAGPRFAWRGIYSIVATNFIQTHFNRVRLKYVFKSFHIHLCFTMFSMNQLMRYDFSSVQCNVGQTVDSSIPCPAVTSETREKRSLNAILLQLMCSREFSHKRREEPLRYCRVFSGWSRQCYDSRESNNTQLIDSLRFASFTCFKHTPNQCSHHATSEYRTKKKIALFLSFFFCLNDEFFIHWKYLIKIFEYTIWNLRNAFLVNCNASSNTRGKE